MPGLWSTVGSGASHCYRLQMACEVFGNEGRGLGGCNPPPRASRRTVIAATSRTAALWICFGRCFANPKRCGASLPTALQGGALRAALLHTPAGAWRMQSAATLRIPRERGMSGWPDSGYSFSCRRKRGLPPGAGRNGDENPPESELPPGLPRTANHGSPPASGLPL